jgi:hypothetical protein
MVYETRPLHVFYCWSMSNMAMLRQLCAAGYRRGVGHIGGGDKVEEQQLED